MRGTFLIQGILRDPACISPDEAVWFDITELPEAVRKFTRITLRFSYPVNSIVRYLLPGQMEGLVQAKTPRANLQSRPKVNNMI